jgi:hypothetical protein
MTCLCETLRCGRLKRRLGERREVKGVNGGFGEGEQSRNLPPTSRSLPVDDAKVVPFGFGRVVVVGTGSQLNLVVASAEELGRDV